METRLTLEGENIVAAVWETVQAACFEGRDNVTGSVATTSRGRGIRSSVAAPVLVDGWLLGTVIAVNNESEPPPGDPEEFTELAATAGANAETRGALSRLADEQAALRRVATLVAQGVPPTTVFDAVAEELGRLLGVASTGLVRFECDETATVVAGWGRLGEVVAVGARLPVGGLNIISVIARTGKPARLDDFATRGSGMIGDAARRVDTRAAVGAPIVVAGRPWGAMIAAALSSELPPDVEPRLAQFTELAATAILNSEARSVMERLANEQSALRRVATLVAQGATPTEVFDAVVMEIGRLLGAAQVGLMRAESKDEITILAHRGQPGRVHIGLRLPLDGDSVTARVLATGRPAGINHDELHHGAVAAIARANKVSATVGHRWWWRAPYGE